jgi:hypothetical protein
MAMFGRQRDISLFRHVNRELMGNIVSQQCAFYKIITAETKVNIYGEAAGSRYYNGPVLLNTLIERGDPAAPIGDFGVDYERVMTFRFLRDDLVDASIHPDVGDIILWNEGYFEIDNTVENQLFVGKDPDYPNVPNPLNSGLSDFGYNVSINCVTHYVPADRVQITKERF